MSRHGAGDNAPKAPPAPAADPHVPEASQPMRIGFFVNDIATEQGIYTTTKLAYEAHRRGHTVCYVGVEDFAFGPGGRVVVKATQPPSADFDDADGFLQAVQGSGATRRRMNVTDLDVLLLRNDPAEDQVVRPWAQTIGILFGHAAALRGVLVVNDPSGLSLALNKMYLEHFPQEVRPETLITRDVDEIRGFIHAHEGGTVLKPLQGSGGESVFLVQEGDHPNVNQIVDAVRRYGYVIAQQYIPEAAERDTRLFLVNGRPLEVDGSFCAFSRLADADLRTNMSVGATAEHARVDPEMLELAEMVRPRLVQDGMFLVGLDIAGGKIIEVNVFSPGGLEMAERFTGKDFSGPVLDALQTKLEYRRTYPQAVPNRVLAAL